mgnify:CR=1 FL=1
MIRSVVAVYFFTAFVAFLRFKAHGRDGARVETFERNRLACVFAIPKLVSFNAAQRGIYFRDKFALTIPCAQLKSAIGFFRRTVRDVWNTAGSVLQTFKCVAAFIKQLSFPSFKRKYAS